MADTPMEEKPTDPDRRTPAVAAGPRTSLAGDSLLDGIFAGIRDGIVVLDRDHTIVRVNPAVEQRCAHAMPLVGRKCYDVFHGRSTPCENCHDQQVFDHGKVVTSEAPIDPSNPDSPWYETRSFPLRDPATGEINGVVQYTRDVTNRRRARHRLAEAEQRLHDALDAIFECVTVYTAVRDSSGRIVDFQTTFANLSACRIHHKTREQMVSETISDRDPGFPKTEAFTAYCRVVETGQPYVLDSVYHTHDGGPQLVRRAYTTRVAKFGDGIVLAWHDITSEAETREQLRSSEQRFHDCLDAIFDCVTIYTAVRDAGGRIVDFQTVFGNAAACRVWNSTPENLLRHTIGQRTHAFPTTELFAGYCRTVQTGEPYVADSVQYTGGGETPRVRRAYNLRATKFGDGIVLAWHDITQEVATREQLRDSEQRFRTSLETILDAFAIYTAVRDDAGKITDFRIEYVNESACAANGLTRDRQIGHLLSEVQPRIRLSGLLDDFIRTVETGEPLIKDAWLYKERAGADPAPRALDVRAAKLGDGVAVTWRDITDRKLLETQLQALTIVDEATGLYNRRGFMTLAEQQIKIADRAGTELYLLFGDLDNLKTTNDGLGHREGDRVINDTAQVIRATFRDADILGRIGGDEFVVLMTDPHGITPDQLAARFRNAIEAHNRAPSAPAIALSFGIARYDPADPCPLDALMKRADALMYEDKRRRRG